MSVTETRRLNVLVSGAGIAGLTAAHFLLRAGHAVTIVERSPAIRASGQNVDVRGQALAVLQHMSTADFDVEAAVRDKVTKEKGLRFVDEKNRSWADFPVGDGTSFTSEIEIMRGDLANILYDSIKNMPNLAMLYGRKVDAIEEVQQQVRVSINESWLSASEKQAKQDFDLIIAADGITSSTRSIAFGPTVADSAVKPLGQWSCWFSIPWSETDTSWARWYNAPRGRMILVRPDRTNGNLTRVSLWTMTRDRKIEEQLTSLLKSAWSSTATDQQKAFWTKLFTDAGWEAPRILEGLTTAPDFHMQKIAQVKLSSWSHMPTRTVLVGDAAYCPSPISGMGITTAMTGAYVLAGEINGHPTDLPWAFAGYEEKTRPLINSAQKLSPGTPGLANPESKWGILVLYWFLGVVAWVKRSSFFGQGGGGGDGSSMAAKGLLE